MYTHIYTHIHIITNYECKSVKYKTERTRLYVYTQDRSHGRGGGACGGKAPPDIM